jgi:hypothetical protein
MVNIKLKAGIILYNIVARLYNLSVFTSSECQAKKLISFIGSTNSGNSLCKIGQTLHITVQTVYSIGKWVG